MPKDILLGSARLNTPLLNKSTAFSLEEREKYQLIGLLPPQIESIEEQVKRIKFNFDQSQGPMAKHIFLRALQDTNETLFYRFLNAYIIQTLPIVYTPTVGDACQYFSDIYRKPRGVFLTYPERQHLPKIIANLKKTHDIRVIVITDGERILGLGDQGLGGMGIPIGKLSLYTVCAGIHPKYTLPIVLDVGTNNPDKLNQPDYLGWKHPRLNGQDYFDFVDNCIQALHQAFPKALIQFEDFAQDKAYRLLAIYRDQICCFNDDIQGTAAVTGATVLAAIKKSGQALAEQKIVLFGAGAAGCGIAQLIIQLLMHHGIPEADAKNQIFMIDKQGLLHDKIQGLKDFQQTLTHSSEQLSTLFDTSKSIPLNEVIRKIKPQILIGVSGQAQQFTQEIVEDMMHYCQHPIIFPLSNPNDRCEANPQDLINWSKGQAIIACGSPFNDHEYQGQNYQITQCNNAYIFPGIGLGVLSGNITRVTESMFIAAANCLSEISPNTQEVHKNILASLKDIRSVSEKIAHAIIVEGIHAGVCQLPLDDRIIAKAIQDNIWQADYE